MTDNELAADNFYQENKHQSRTLASLRYMLMPKLLSGELNVGGVHLSESPL